MDYLITRHPGALHWMRQQLQIQGTHLIHIERMDHFGPGNCIFGTLPINLAAAVCARGARYLHLELDLPAQLRGQELSAAQLTLLNARLVEYLALRILPDKAVIGMSAERQRTI